MKHTHVIEASSAEEFKKEVADLYHELYGGRDVISSGQATCKPSATTTATAAAAANEEKIPAKRGPKPKEKEAAPVVAHPAATTPVQAPTAVSAEEDVFGDSAEPNAPKVIPYTQDDCSKRLQTVVSMINIVKAKEILAKFKAKKLVDLTPDQYSDFVAACDEVTP